MRSAGRTALLLPLPAALIGYGWARIEHPTAPFWTFVWVALLGCAPALLPRLSLRLAAAVVTLALALHTALRVSVLDARPHDSSHNFFGPLISHFGRGLGDYYDFTLPFDRHQHVYMHGVALLATFAGCLCVGLCVAARKPAAAALALLVWAAWPMTLLTGPGDLRNGAYVLVGVLFLLAAVRAVPGRRAGLAVLLTGLLVAAALGVSTSPAVAKGEFLNWQSWDFYTRPDNPVGVEYVWNSDYRGITFPKKVTTVFRVQGPARPYYWRATTLDQFYHDGWIEDLGGIFGTPTGAPADLRANPLLPKRARNPQHWVQETVTMAALRDPHLVAPATPVEFEGDSGTAISHTADGVAFAQPVLTRGQSYKVWSYAPQPTPRQLEASKPIYPAALQRDLDLDDGTPATPFGSNVFSIRPVTVYAPLYKIAARVAGGAKSPYAATVAIEAWFRSNPAFSYNQHPTSPPGIPPLVWFVTQGKQGYCQHFAGAMALMLRSLGIPSRVAAGFTSGTYDPKHRQWTVTDHDAHTWVEVWFRGYGWLPFDPTPSRGTLGGTYSTSSPTFDAAGTGLLAEAKRLGLTGFDVKRANDSGFDPTGKLGGLQADVPRHGGGGVTGVLTNTPRNESLLRLLAIVALCGLALVVAVKTGLRWGRFATRDPRRVAAACRRELTDFLVDQRIAVPRSATPHELSALVHDELGVDGRAFASAVSGARFGPPDGARASARLARRERKRLLHSVRGAVPWPRRALGLVSLRSLGVTR